MRLRPVSASRNAVTSVKVATKPPPGIGLPRISMMLPSGNTRSDRCEVPARMWSSRRCSASFARSMPATSRRAQADASAIGMPTRNMPGGKPNSSAYRRFQATRRSSASTTLMPWLMFSSAASSRRWLKRRSSLASPTIAATVSRSAPRWSTSAVSRRAASSSNRADALPRIAASSCSSRDSMAMGTGPRVGAWRSSSSTRCIGRKRRPALRSVCRSEPSVSRRCGTSRSVASSNVTDAPTNRLTPTARPNRLQPVRPNRASGASHDRPNGPSCNHAGLVPLAAARVGTSITHDQATNAASTPPVAALAGVAGRHSANPSAGASVASAENDTAPTSAKASLPLTRRL